jgi:hypothetical protein
VYPTRSGRSMRERTAPSRAAAARPVGVSGRQGAKQQSLITSFGDRKMTAEENAQMQVLQLKAHLACGLSFRAADKYEYVFFLRQLRPGFEPAGNKSSATPVLWQASYCGMPPAAGC